jgi:lysine-ketoglutarate reductase/saccharopine dehydrogenase-like protein (TIGR00300 family)
MDCAVAVDGDRAHCIPINDLTAGQPVVVGHRGIRVVPLERSRSPLPTFGFMGSTVSSERPSGRAVREAAVWMRQCRTAGLKNLVVAGPAVIHTASRDYLCRLIERGYVDLLFAGNALATHDIEYSFYGTSLGVPLDGGKAVETGHEHHLRAINRIRSVGGVRPAVERGLLTSGVMYSCVKHGVEFVLAGSIRDDGPLPDVVTDVIDAQREMRRRIHAGVQVALMLSTMLHSIAVGNLLPATVYTVCVDINPSTLTKLVDRGSFQTLGIVMDVGGFLRDLLAELDHLENTETNVVAQPTPG